MTDNLSEYKYKKMAVEYFENGLRLYFDAVYLFNKGSYPSALQLAIISLEEISKSNWIEDYYWNSITNDGFPDYDFEQEWLNLLYKHPTKQIAFFSWSLPMEYSPKFIKAVGQNELEILKQKATYVGLRKQKNKVDIKSRISLPKNIKMNEPKRIISLLNDYLTDVYKRKKAQGECYDLEEKDALINYGLFKQLKKWNYKTGLRSSKWTKQWLDSLKETTMK